jgi:hypothetical protein
MGVMSRLVYKADMNDLPSGSVIVLKDQGPVPDDVTGEPVYGSMALTKLGDYWIGTGVEVELYPDDVYDTSFPAILVYQR